ncbi:marR family protein [Synechococcus sp. PROS-9-1]|uniref:MarR family transcriptional regulator n=1 Tax=Synechococcus sp. PROS-9-1 TaxID=1968775 RepID=UPI001648A53B|nr:MarR family transcriptional regulator [Synechococcus sp. PROS-9-1]QNJ32740.1 marR family protein [Synechococcus sp. PROS-9-1]
MEVLKAFSKSEVEIIRLIALHPGVVSSFLEDSLSLDQPHVSKVLKRLLSKGYIRRIKVVSTGKRDLLRYYINPSYGVQSVYSLIDKDMDNLVEAFSTRHSTIYRFLAALYDVDSVAFSAFNAALQEVLLLRQQDDALSSSSSMSCMDDSSARLKHRNRLAVRFWRKARLVDG